MAIPEFTLRQLMEAGVHFGHHTRRWNPKMREYIFGVRNGVHIIDLQQTKPLVEHALTALRDITAKGGRVLFVGTKRQAADRVRQAAEASGQFFVNHRWLGGMVTNWKTMSKSIARLRELEALFGDEEKKALRTKKELLLLEREKTKLTDSLGGIADMGGKPDAMVIIDVNKDDIAVKEANKLGIPVIGIVDTNASPDGIDYIIPGNDDALRAIDLYCELFTGAILDGLQAELATGGKDLGEAEEVQVNLPASDVAAKNKAAKASDKVEELTPGEAAKQKAQAKKDAKKEDAPAAEDAAKEDATDEKKVASA